MAELLHLRGILLHRNAPLREEQGEVLRGVEGAVVVVGKAREQDIRIRILHPRDIVHVLAVQVFKAIALRELRPFQDVVARLPAVVRDIQQALRLVAAGQHDRAHQQGTELEFEAGASGEAPVVRGAGTNTHITQDVELLGLRARQEHCGHLPTHRVGQHEGRVLLPQLQAALDRADGAREVGAREIVIAPVLGAAGGSGGFALAVQLADGNDPAAGGELLGDRLVIAGADAEARPQDDQGFLPIMAALSGGAWLGCGAVLGTCLGRSRRRVHRAFVAHWRWSEDAHGRGAAVRHLHVHPLAVHILDGNYVIFAHPSHDMCAPDHIWLYQDNALG